MALGTRGVLAILAGLTMLAALVVARVGKRLLATWLLMVGFVFATLWSVLSLFWSQSHPSAFPTDVWVTSAAMAAAAVVYFGYLGLYGDGLGE